MKLALPLRLLLWPLSMLYGTAARLTAWLYAHGIYTVKHLNAPVISVGNLTVGGTGKTPMGGPIVLTMPRPAATALPRRSVPGMLGQRAENSSCRSLGTSEQAGKPIAIVERAHAKLPVKCAAKPPFVSKTALHGDLLEA